METYNSLGFTNFWGVTPAYNILKNENLRDDAEINILLSNSNDIRHILKTFFENFENNKKKYKIKFYIYERHRENIARLLVFMHIIHDIQLSMRDRIELFMEIYGNTLLSSRTADYLNNLSKILINFITSDKKYTGVLRNFIDISNLSFREKDEISEILKAYDLRIPFDIEKYRDDRLRYHFKDRYDYRENLVDWDYVYKLKENAPVINQKHYTKFRMSGVTFEMRINSYHIPNRTLSSYIPGRTKDKKDSCLVRGFWGDITNSPYIGFGVELNNQEEHDFFYAHNDVYYKFHSQHITEWNLARYLSRLEKDELYELKYTEHKVKHPTPDKDDSIKNEKDEESQKIKKETKQNENVKDNESQDQSNLTTEATVDDLKDINKEENKMTDKDINLNNLKIEDGKQINNNNEQINESYTDKFVLDKENKDKTLMGFEFFDMKIVLLTGEIDQIFKKKKYKNFFDFALLGFHSKNIFENLASVLKTEGKVLAELSTYMASFEDKDKSAFKEKYKTIGNDSGFILDDQNSKFIWKYIYKPKKEQEENEIK